MSESKRPRVFVSYAWEDGEYKTWVERLALRLWDNGVNARLDAWHRGERRFGQFMNSEVRNADCVLVVCSPQYRTKVHEAEDGGKVTGVGWESGLLTSAMLGGKPLKVRLALGRGSLGNAVPSFLDGWPCHDLTDEGTFEKNYRALLQEIYGLSRRPSAPGQPPPDLAPSKLEPLRGTEPPAATEESSSVPTANPQATEPERPRTVAAEPHQAPAAFRHFNVGLNRTVRVGDGNSGSILGCGFRFGPTSVLTSQRLVASVGAVRIDDPDGRGFRSRAAQLLWPQSGVSSEVVLLETDKVRGVPPFRPLLSGEIPSGTPWRAYAYGLNQEEPPRRWVLSGQVGTAESGGYRLALDSAGPGKPSLEALWPWRGAGILAKIDGRPWGLLGVLGIEGSAESWACKALSLEEFSAWEEFEDLFQGREAAAWCQGYQSRVASYLANPEVRQAIVRKAANEAWEAAASASPEALAEALCLGTEPHILAEGLLAAYEWLAEQQKLDAAEQVYQIAVEAVPSALYTHWPIDFPDASATEVEVEVVYEELVEVLLAAAGALPLRYRFAPQSGSLTSDFSVLKPPGDLGADPDGEDAAAEMTWEALLQIPALAGLNESSSSRVQKLFGQIARHRRSRSGPRLFGVRDIKAMQNAIGEPEGGWGETFLQAVNDAIVALARTSGRYLWVLRDRDHVVTTTLRRLLPDLQIVGLAGGPNRFQEEKRLVDALHNLLARRHATRSDS